ncbi:hypothetical protein NU688_31345 [Variovorax sp. ZS18.2.2]|uniref:hypothetical protein n=1 Tax=Variovorax sp. ZS18.2.2 TaxID=2971255 RepID=UPI002150C1DE|nr:hypothetical protein [Variovorax sp. ZS18.2.2]MCR6480686.1 hypothetical protein [Variovorax sp. ZS18.2.2]
MDDEDSKIRRNLMLAGSLVLLFAWLQIPEGALLKRIFGEVDPTVSISPVRVWIAITAALVYLALRFRFSKDHEEGQKELTFNRGVIETRFVKLWLCVEVWWFKRLRTATPLFGAFLREWENTANIRSTTQKVAPPVVIKHVQVVEVHSGYKDGAGQWVDSKDGTWSVRVQLEFWSDNGSEGVSGVQEHNFFLTKSQRFLVRVAQLCWLIVYSRSSTLLIFPWAITVLALVACSFKLFRLL